MSNARGFPVDVFVCLGDSPGARPPHIWHGYDGGYCGVFARNGDRTAAAWPTTTMTAGPWTTSTCTPGSPITPAELGRSVLAPPLTVDRVSVG